MALWHRAHSDKCFFSLSFHDWSLFHCWKANPSLRLSRNLGTREEDQLTILTSIFYANNTRTHSTILEARRWTHERVHIPQVHVHWLMTYKHIKKSLWVVFTRQAVQLQTCSSNSRWKVSPTTSRTCKGALLVAQSQIRLITVHIYETSDNPRARDNNCPHDQLVLSSISKKRCVINWLHTSLQYIPIWYASCTHTYSIPKNVTQHSHTIIHSKYQERARISGCGNYDRLYTMGYGHKDEWISSNLEMSSCLRLVPLYFLCFKNFPVYTKSTGLIQEVTLKLQPECLCQFQTQHLTGLKVLH